MFLKALLTTEEVLGQTCDEDNVYHDANPGVGETQGGQGGVSLQECLDRLGTQANLTISATCHAGEGSRDAQSVHANPSHYLSMFGFSWGTSSCRS